MKLVKSLLLGSAAGLCAVAGAQAADLPMRKAAPVEYVRVCTASGAGFFYIPGTDTCLRIGGRARMDYQYTEQTRRNASTSGYLALGRISFDARTQTPYGSLRTFVRIDMANRSGGYLKSGTQERRANAFTATGADTNGQLQKYVEIDKAFVQFAGITAGRAQSFYDFYAGDIEMIGGSISSSTNTNLLAYTATFGGGFSATVSMEDPVHRRAPVFYNVATGTTGFAAGATPAAQSGVNFLTGAVPLAFVATGFNAAGVPVSANALDVSQRSYMPDFVGALRYDAPWGAVQVSGAVHEIKVGEYVTGLGSFPVNGAAVVPATTVLPRIPSAEYGWAVQGGVKLNVPQIAPGDQLWLQAAYGEGAGQYTGVNGPPGFDTITSSNIGRFNVNQVDAALTARGQVRLTQTYGGFIGFLHYWTPEWRQALFASHGQVIYDSILRTSQGPAGGTATVRSIFDPTLRSYGITYVGSNLIWSPVRDLDIGVEVAYERIDIRGRVADTSKGGTVPAAGAVAGGTGRVTGVDDNILARLRVQRDF
ncbi:MAG: porin [Enterovirga sp.]|jgi:hypothetical protein|nr:porin [Enterovirga sp.]